jgi:quercetin dioxygenase-like cupin family protein
VSENKIETVEHLGKPVCMIIRATSAPESTKFYTPREAPLQVGHIIYKAGASIAPHSHPATTRTSEGSPEVLVVQSGRVSFDIFDEDRARLGTWEIAVGDVVIFFSGGHGFRFLEDTILLEVKLGPFLGDQDRERF